ncbi:MAG: translesion error-prone DNA polymerase V autoproteolytic subunit [Gammaproteobacteria bacterium]|nr:translesion error-prone DNA polymerase V autoproteolytic subunit [Gammaproteobacteria bacterium]
MGHGGKRKGAGRPKGQGQYGEPTQPIRLPESLIEPVLKFVKNKGYQLPLFSSKVAAGHPSSVDDHIETYVNLQDHLIKNISMTFLVRVSGQSMIDAGIFENDLLVVDRSIVPSHGKIVIAAIDSQFTVKRLHQQNNQLFLMPENKKFKPITITPENEMIIFGVVTHVIHAV